MSFRSLWSLVLVLLISFSAPSSAQETRKTIVLIFPIKVTGLNLTVSEREGIKDYLGTRLTMEGVYKVMPESQVKRDLGQAKAQSYNDCYDEACRIDLTKTVYADKSLSVDVVSEGRACRVTAKLYDIAQEATESAADVETGCSAKEIKAAMVVAGAQLSGRTVESDATRSGAPGGGTVTAGVKIDRGENIVNAITDQTGLLFVDTDPPKANILINGKPYGKAPYQDALMIGRYVVTATLNSYYHDATQEINLTTQGATVSLKLAPAFGTFRITSEPSDSEVLIDDKPVGRTPFSDTRMKSGDYRVEVRRDLYKSESIQVSIEDGKDVTKAVRLAADFGGLNVQTDPQGAVVLIDGKDTGKVTPVSFQQISTGLHIVTLDLKAHGRRVENVRVTPGQTAQINARLEPKMGLLTVMTVDPDGSPCKGTLTIDGQPVGETPWKGNLVAAEHTITAKCDDGVKSELVNVEYNGSQTLKIQVERNVKIIKGERPVAAVFGIKTSGLKLPPTVADRLTRYFESRLVSEGTYKVVPPEVLRTALLRQKEASYHDVSDEVCRIELGAKATSAADRVISMNVVKADGTCSVTASVYDIRTELVEGAAEVATVDCSEAGLMKAIQVVARRLSKGIKVVGDAPVVREGSGGKPILAISDIDSSGLSLGESVLEKFAERIMVVVVNAGGYSVLPQSVIKQIRTTMKISPARRYELETLIEIGKRVSADMILNTRIYRLDGGCQIIGAIFDLRKALYEKSWDVATKDCSESSLKRGISEMAAKVGR